MAKISYLHGRDPSIFYRNNCKPQPLFSTVTEEKEGDKDALNVYLRIRKTDQEVNYSIDGNVFSYFIPNASQSGKNIKEGEKLVRMFTFTEVFPPDTSQCEIFQRTVKAEVLDFINGKNSNILTYGASGAGKTYTIVGTDTQPGIVPQSLEYLFRTLSNVSLLPKAKPKCSGNVVTWLTGDQQLNEIVELETLLDNPIILEKKETYRRTYKQMQKRLSVDPVASISQGFNVNVNIWISFAEIYNEVVFDLLESNMNRNKKLRIINNNGETYIKGLKHICVTNACDAFLLFQFGLNNLMYASTTLNRHSSRSHFLFTLTLVQTLDHSDDETGSVEGLVNRITFCDLAGSERSKKTNNKGTRMKESNCINNSLFVLGRCINSIRNNQHRKNKSLVPYRDSKLTSLFQRALQGNERISMIININPDPLMADESVHSLNFSAIAKDIRIENESTLGSDIFCASEMNYHHLEKEMNDLKQENAELRARLENQILMEEKNIEKVQSSLVNNVDKMLQEVKNDFRSRIKYKDAIISSLNKKLEDMDGSSSDDSIICIDDSDEDEENMLDISKRTRTSRKRLLERYRALFNNSKLMARNITLLQKKIDEQARVIEDQKSALKSQKHDIITLETDIDDITDQLERSVKYNSYIENDYADFEDSSGENSS